MISNTLAELTLFPQQAGAPRAQAPRPQGGGLARAAAPRSRSSQRFPQSWGRIVRPEPKGGLPPRGICNPRSRHRPTPGILGFSTQPRKSPIFGDPPFFDFLTGVRTSECRHRRLWLMVRKAPNGPRTRLRHCHSSPQDASMRKINAFFGKIGRQSVNLHSFLQEKVSRIDDRLPKDCHFGPFLGSPPTIPRNARARAAGFP